MYAMSPEASYTFPLVGTVLQSTLAATATVCFIVGAVVVRACGCRTSPPPPAPGLCGGLSWALERVVGLVVISPAITLIGFSCVVSLSCLFVWTVVGAIQLALLWFYLSVSGVFSAGQICGRRETPIPAPVPLSTSAAPRTLSKPETPVPAPALLASSAAPGTPRAPSALETHTPITRRRTTRSRSASSKSGAKCVLSSGTGDQ